MDFVEIFVVTDESKVSRAKQAHENDTEELTSPH